MPNLKKSCKVLPGLALASLIGLLSVPLSASFELYWTDSDNRILGANIDGSAAQVVFDENEDFTVDVVVTDDFLYWVDNTQSRSSGGIWRANTDGTSPELLIENDGSFRDPQFIAIDEGNNKLYFTCVTEGVLSADLDDGGNLELVSDPANTITGIALIGNDEAFVVSAAEGDTNLYRVNLSDGASTVEYNFAGHHHAQYALVFDAEAGGAGQVFVSNVVDGAVDGYDLATQGEFEVVSFEQEDILQPLGLRLSPSRTHLVIADRHSGNIWAYDFDEDEYFVAAPVGNAHFGVAVTEEPAPIPPMPAADLPIVDTFEHGTPGEPVGGQPTSDGKAVWRVPGIPGDGVDLVYGEDGDDTTLVIRSEDGDGVLYLDADVRDVENYSVRIGKMTVQGLAVSEGTAGTQDGDVSFGARRLTGASASPGYRWSPATFAGADRVPFWFRPHIESPDGNLANPPSPVTYENVELRVRGNEHRMYEDGIPLDPHWRPTEAEFEDEEGQRAVQFRLSSIEDTDAWVEMELSDITVEAWVPPEIPDATDDWQMVDDFAARDLGEIDGQGQWRQTAGGIGEVIENPFGDSRVLYASGGLYTIPINIPDGEVGTVYFRARATGMTDFSFGTSKEVVMHGLSNEAASQVAFRGANNLDVIDQPAGPGHIHTLTSHDSHTWYDIWMVVDNDNKTQSYYIQGGEFDEPTLLSDDQDRTVFDFRRADDHAGEDIFSFGMRAFNVGPVYLDQVWFKGLGTEAEVTRPDGVGPIPVEDKDETGPLFAYEGFSYPEGDVAGLTGGAGWAEPWRADGNHVSPQVVSPGFTHDDLAVTGNRLQVQNIGGGSTGAVGFRFLELGMVDPDLLDEFGHLGRPGTSVYLSFIGQGVEPITDSFWGISTFRAGSERLFVGKSSNVDDGWRLVQASTPNRIDSDVPFGDLSFFVVRLDYLEEPEEDGDDLIYARGYLFHNPDPAGAEPALDQAVAEIELTAPQGFNRVRVSGREEGFEIDEIRAGLNWDAVTPDEIEPDDGFEQWAVDQGLPAGQRGTHDDPVGDSVTNLMAYALGLDPLVANRGHPNLPVRGIEPVGENEYLSLSYVRPSGGRDDVTYNVEAAGELGVWDDAVFVRINDLGDGLEEVVYRDSVPLGDGDRRFLRLHVELNQ